MDRVAFSDTTKKLRIQPMWKKCFVSLEAMCRMLKPEDMNSKSPQRHYSGGSYCTYSNHGIASAYNPSKNTYKVTMQELTGPSKTVWFKAEDLSFVP